ncbi:MAG: N-acetylmuramoyl-L-alanine amidase family protein [Chthoniobacterales bacterium]
MNRRRLFLFCLTTALLGAFTASSRAAAEWQVIKINGWDYLTVDNIARFYGFAADVTPINKRVHLDNGRNQLELALDSREAIVNGVRNWLCFPVIERGGKYLVSRIDLAKTIEPQFRPHMIKNLGRLKTVVIDPGHGGVEKGASSSYGNEKDFTLDVALKLRPLLQAKGFNVVMTRDKDELVPLHDRARIANATRDSIFVSIHFNATDYNTSATGFEIYSLTPRGAPSTQDVSLEERFANMQVGSPVDAQSIALSTSVYHSMLGYMPEFDRGVKRARFAVLRLTGIPAILVEGGFLTERDESREVASPSWRAKLAQAIAAGIDSYRGLVEKHERPMLLADYRRQIEGVLVARNATAPNESSRITLFPASNQFFPSTQFTQPVRHEPSEQIAVPSDMTPTIAATTPVTQPPAPSPAEGEVAHAEESDEQLAGALAAADEAGGPADNAVEMPDPQEESVGLTTGPATEERRVSDSRTAAQLRRARLVQFDPHAKF